MLAQQAENLGKALGVLALQLPLVVNPQALPDRLVDEPSDQRLGSQVGLVQALGEDFEADVQSGLHVLEADTKLLDDPFGAFTLAL